MALPAPAASAGADVSAAGAELMLLADIGGTNSRLALTGSVAEAPQNLRIYPNRDFPGLEAVISHYLTDTGAAPQRACVAVACPVTHDHVQLTNNVWSFSRSALQARFAFRTLRVINDFTAIANSLPYLPESNVRRIGGGETAVPGAAMAVLGPGTGLGVSGLVAAADGSGWHAITGEGGHVSLAPTTEEEFRILQIGWQEYGAPVSAERVLSGMGLAFLYRAMASLRGWPERAIPEETITHRALQEGCPNCRAVLDQFCAFLGNVAGNLALTLGALGGVFIAGGIVPRFGDAFEASPFRANFENKGRFGAYLRPIPTYLIPNGEQAALTGAAAALVSG